MAEDIIKRQMPNSADDAELAVIGAMIIDREAISRASELLTIDDFYSQQNGAVFQAIVDLYNEGVMIDDVVIREKLASKNISPDIASPERISRYMDSSFISTNVKEHCKYIKDKALLRNIIRTNQDIENACFEGVQNVDDILDKAESSILGMRKDTGSSQYVPVNQVVKEALKNIDAASKTEGNVTGIPTGFRDLDFKTAGMQNSDLILLAARPSMGKTAFVLNLAENMAIKAGKHVAIFSLEMSKVQLINRILSLESRVDAQKLRTGNLQENDWAKLLEGAAIVSKSGLILDDTPGITVAELRRKCRRFKSEVGLDIIMIDYLQLMQGNSKEGRQQEISEISRSLKALARELNVPVIALSQLSRAVEQRPDHRPMLSDLRESGAIEQDADVVMFIYRDDYYNHDSEKKGVSEIIIAKQRNGPIGTVELTWLPEFTKFANKEHSEQYKDL